MKQQVHVFYEGHVQGVGFRYTAEEKARRLGLTGWVRNLRDGRVELVAEGEEGVVLAFLEQMRDGPLRQYIEHAEVTWSHVVDRFDHFEIRPTT